MREQCSVTRDRGGRASVVAGIAVLILWLAATFSPARAATPQSPARLQVTWQNALIEEAVQELSDAAGAEAQFFVDSYDLDTLRDMHTIPKATLPEVVRLLGRRFNREVWRTGDVYLLRHPRWFDDAFVSEQTRQAESLPRTCQIRTSTGGRLELVVLRMPLEKVTSALARAARQPHSVDARFRARKVTGFMKRAAPEQFRQAVAALFPDAVWIRDGRKWHLKERPFAALIRQVAADLNKRPIHPDIRLEIPLAIQITADLKSSQWVTLQRTGRVVVPWRGMSSVSRQLFLQQTEAMARIVEQNGRDPRTDFADLSRTSDMEAEVRLQPDGTLRFTWFGRDPGGGRRGWGL